MKKVLSLLLSTILVLMSALPVLQARPAMADDGGGGYLYGKAGIYSTYNHEVLEDSFYYNDEWFGQNPEEVNNSLALVSMQLVASGVELDESGPVAAFLEGLGFESVGFSDGLSTDPWGCSYTWATKTVEIGGESRTLAAVIIQSYSDDQQTKTNGWNQNFVVNGEEASGEHAGLAAAAYSILGNIVGLGDPDNTTYWLMGHSRGGAVANIVAAHLPEANPSAAGHTFAYTFESPNTVDEALLPENSYGYIHNYVCSDDVVTMVPMWGMARYGNDWLLNSSEADAKLFENLKKLGSGAAEQEGSYDAASNTFVNLLGALAAAIPTREDYSAVHTDYALDPLGNDMPISYAYQDVFVKLSTIAMSGALSGFSASTILQNTDILAPVLAMWIKAVRYDDPTQYWAAAASVKGLFGALGIDIPLEVEDFYAILKLLGPYLLDPNKAPDTFDGDFYTYLMAVNPEVFTLLNMDPQLFSHQGDTAIARLKGLAPSPLMESLDIVIPEPAAGDALVDVSNAVYDFISSLGEEWLTSSTSWIFKEGEVEIDEINDAVLEDGRVYYLEITVEGAEHVAVDDFAMTLNGQEPIEPLSMSYEDGTQVASGIWKIAIGEPETVTVSFDPVKGEERPESVQVQKGEQLKYVMEAPVLGDVQEEGVVWKHLGGWHNANDTQWRDVIALADTELVASWEGQINDVEVVFEVPHAGDLADGLTVTAPDGAPYRIEDVHLLEATYENAEGALEEKEYILSFRVAPVDDSMTFLYETDEDGAKEYAGKAAVNDEEVEAAFNSEENCLGIEYRFRALPAEAGVAYRCTSGDGSTWTKGSDTAATFTFSRSEADDTAYDHFAEIRVDGEAVDEEMYLAEKGSVVITLETAYLETLDVGGHKLTAEFDDGSADAKFTIKASDDSKDDSGDDSRDESGDDSGTGFDDESGDDSGSGFDDESTARATVTPSASSARISVTATPRATVTPSASSTRTSVTATPRAAVRATVTPRTAASTTVSARSVSTATPTATKSSTTTSSKTGTTSAKTGDETDPLFWALLALAAGAVIGARVRFRRG
ncbi:MAG: hypothetical protein Q4A32_08595 [Lachnospiraceae bacterium]|nr:hypothetical protein [Lachnospiraceae bacterium]